MGTLSYTYTMANGETADGDQVQTSLDEAKAVINGNIDNNNIADNSISAGKIQTDAVEEAKILNGAVTENKVDTDAISTNKIQDEAVMDTKVDYQQVGGCKVLRIGPDTTAFGSQGLMLARCENTGIDPTGGGEVGVSITIGPSGSDARDSDPKFVYDAGNLPHCVGWSYEINGQVYSGYNIPTAFWIDQFSNSGGYITTIDCYLYFPGSPGTPTSGTLYTTWVGETDSTT